MVFHLLGVTIMRGSISRFALLAAAAAMAVMPVAAQAGTRAGDSAALYFAPVSAQIVYDDTDEEAIWKWDDVLVALIGISSVAAILFLIDDGPNQSPGT